MRVRLRVGGRARYRRFGRDEIRLRADAKHDRASRMMWAAGGRVKRAIRQGLLPRLDGSVRCTDCGNPATMYDHRSYAQPLNVQPVCRPCNCRRSSASEFPARRRNKGRTYPVEALMATAETREPIRVLIGDRTATTVAGGLRMVARRHGAAFHYRFDGTAVLAWVEPNRHSA